MIKIRRIDKPQELTEEVQNKLTDVFKQNKKKSVWNKKYIRDNLLIESSNKCVYCECFIGNGHKEMHVDHFHYKDKYEDEVVIWENLNPSCPHCNKNKGYHDTYESPIINPFEQNPQDYFYLKNYRYYSRSDETEKIVRNTIDVLGLNDTEEVVESRFNQGEALINKIQDIYEFAVENQDVLCTETRKRNRVLTGCRNILKKGVRESEFSAFMATIIHDDQYYINLKELLERNGLWNSELQELHDATLINKFDTHR